MRCFRGGLTLGVHKIPFRVFSSISNDASAAESGDFSLVLGGAALSAFTARASVRQWAGTVGVPRDCYVAPCVAAAAGVVGRGRTRLGRERQGAVPLRRGDVLRLVVTWRRRISRECVSARPKTAL